MEVQIASLCDSAADYGGKLCLIGAFDTILVRQFPAQHPFCSVALRIVFRDTDEGKHALRVNLIDDDGANAAVLDEQGRLLAPDELLWLIAEGLIAGQSDGAVVIENGARECLQPRVAAAGIRCWLGGWTQAELWQTLRNDAAICGGGASGRVWLRDTFPATDAILTLASLLQVLSQDDRACSDRIPV